MSPDSSIRIAVLVATCDRPTLLAHRALPSIRLQTRRPDILIVVDDGDPRRRNRVEDLVHDLHVPGCEVVFVPNTRTRGASGAWNTGLELLHRRVDPASTYVAILDDDDEWTADHLAACEAVALGTRAALVAPGLRRVDARGTREQPAPARIEESALLVGNPHLQGSNLFARLGALLAAGLFDEALPSCTDRDLYLRLGDLPDVAYAPVGRCTVVHHADEGRPRLSEPGSPTKSLGLTRFHAKWRHRMTPEVEAAFLERAARLFGWTPSSAPNRAAPPATAIAPPASVALIAGVISDVGHAVQLERLLEDLLRLAGDPAIAGMDVVILENEAPDGRREGLERAVRSARARGLRIFHASIPRQEADAGQGRFGGDAARPAGRLPIAAARRLLHAYVARVARRRPGAIAWILDDDIRLANRRADGSGTDPRALAGAIARLPGLRDGGASVVLGTFTDAPPLPFSSCLRTQAVDLAHALDRLSRLSPDAIVEGEAAIEALRDAIGRDTYYDLARSATDHLEAPTPFQSLAADRTALGTFLELARRAPRMLCGEQVFRPLVLDEAADVVRDARPSILRGGNTFILDPAAIDDVPNLAPAFGGRTLRRSDMTWALMQRFARGRVVVQAPVPVRQDRSGDEPRGLDLERLVPDIQGFAVYSALEDVLRDRRAQRQRDGLGAAHPDDLRFSAADGDLFERRFRKYLEERLSAWTLSAARVAGLARACRRHLDPGATPGAFWHADPRCAEAIGRFRTLIETLADLFRPEAVAAVRREVLDVPVGAAAAFLGALAPALEAHARRPSEAADPWFDEERTRNAEAAVTQASGAHAATRLGAGTEAVVLTDGERVYKVVDYAKASWETPRWDALRRLAGRPSDPASGLYPIQALTPVGTGLVITYPFEPTTPYRGGHGRGLIALLRGLRDADVAFTNLHPKNLRVAGDRVMLVDYGADLTPLTPGHLDAMIRRAWLTCRCADRPDLADLMRSAPPVPELAGAELLRDAVVGPPAKADLLDARLAARLVTLAPRTLLDFGCGRGEVARLLAAAGVQVTAYDPDPRLQTYWERAPEPVEWLDRRGPLAGRTFDAVTCNLVLCVIEDDEAWAETIDALARHLAPGGTLLLSVCNPRRTFDGDTAFQARMLPPEAAPDRRFVWHKRLASGAVRRDVHRPEARLDAALAAAGLEVRERVETPAFALDDFRPTSDFLIVEAVRR